MVSQLGDSARNVEVAQTSAEVEVSVVMPCLNEAETIETCIRKALSFFAASRVSGEVVVADNGSLDGSIEIARQAGARVIDVQLRKISAVRNAGARQAKGDVFFFVDADTQISERTLRAALHALERGAIGGGAWVTFKEPVNLSVRIGIHVFNFFYMRLLRWAAGCFLYADRKAFEACGGFDETLYASEEILLSRALKRQGKFVILRESVRTSGRKMRMHSPWEIIPFVIRFMLRGPAFLRERKGMDWWYDGKREK